MLDFRHKVSFLRKEKIAQKTWKFIFKKQKNFSYTSGQYISVFIGNDFRDFTIASSPLEKDIFYIITKEGKSSFKQKLFKLQNSSIVDIKSPAGGFILQENSTIPLVFLAGGIGITPFYSMVKYIYEKKLPISVTIFASFSKKEDFIFYDELQLVAKQQKSIKIIYTTARISKELLHRSFVNVKNKTWYIAGSMEMIDNTYLILEKMGIKSTAIKTDIFTGY